jgi:hypothetical protein
VGELGRPRQFHTLKIVGSNPTCATGPVSSNGRMRGCYPRNAGSSPAAGACFPTLVAQWTERPPPKREAAGSTPAEGTAAPQRDAVVLMVQRQHTGLWSRRWWVRFPLITLSMGLVTGETKRL